MAGLSPFVSVLMPVFNCASTVGLSIRSILMQTYENWELLVIDDGSTDDTRDLVASFSDPRITLVADGQHKGLAVRLNEAIDRSQGVYAARMDGDDIAFPERLECQVRFMEANPGVDLLGTAALVFGHGGRLLGAFRCAVSHEEICRRPWSGFPLGHPTWLGRREWFARHRYRPDLSGSEDYDLLLRSYASSRLACLPEFLLGYRCQQMSRRKRLFYRYRHSQAVWSCLRPLCFGRTIQGVLEQVAKGAVDMLVIGNLLESKVFPYRRVKLDATIHSRWNEIWTRINADQFSGAPYRDQREVPGSEGPVEDRDYEPEAGSGREAAGRDTSRPDRHLPR